MKSGVMCFPFHLLVGKVCGFPYPVAQPATRSPARVLERTSSSWTFSSLNTKKELEVTTTMLLHTSQERHSGSFVNISHKPNRVHIGGLILGVYCVSCQLSTQFILPSYLSPGTTWELASCAKRNGD